MKQDEYRPETKAVRGGTELSKKNAPLSTPIYQTSTFQVTDSDQQLRATHTDMFYTRYGNPTNTVPESAIAELEGADAALLFASGMAAITTSVLALLKSGEHSVISMVERASFWDSGCPSWESRPRLWTRLNTISTHVQFGPIRECCIWNRRLIRHCVWW